MHRFDNRFRKPAVFVSMLRMLVGQGRDFLGAFRQAHRTTGILTGY
jgi:hypothetical protein